MYNRLTLIADLLSTYGPFAAGLVHRIKLVSALGCPQSIILSRASTATKRAQMLWTFDKPSTGAPKVSEIHKKNKNFLMKTMDNWF